MITARLVKQVGDRVEKYDRKVRKVRRSSGLKASLIGIGMGLALALTLTAFYNLSVWYDSHRVVFHQPIEVKLFAPVVIAKREEKPQTRALSEQIRPIEVPLWEDEGYLEKIYEQTRFYESNNGLNSNGDATHSYCKTQGKVNEIGYFPEGNRKYCFDSYTSQRETFTKWLAKRLKKGYTVKEALCEYTTGTVQPMCQRTLSMGL